MWISMMNIVMSKLVKLFKKKQLLLIIEKNHRILDLKIIQSKLLDKAVNFTRDN